MSHGIPPGLFLDDKQRQELQALVADERGFEGFLSLEGQLLAAHGMCTTLIETVQIVARAQRERFGVGAVDSEQEVLLSLARVLHETRAEAGLLDPATASAPESPEAITPAPWVPSRRTWKRLVLAVTGGAVVAVNAILPR